MSAALYHPLRFVSHYETKYHIVIYIINHFYIRMSSSCTRSLHMRQVGMGGVASINNAIVFKELQWRLIS
jgi:hypothetical protein